MKLNCTKVNQKNRSFEELRKFDIQQMEQKDE